MIVGILLLYIGLKNGYPTLYLVGCWVAIILGALQGLVELYEAGKRNGKSGTDKGI